MPDKENKVRVTLYLPEDLVERAKIAGIHARRSVSDMVAEGLEPIVDQIEQQRASTKASG